MTTGLTAPEMGVLLDLVGEVFGLLDLDEFRHGVLGALRRAVPSDYVSYNEVGGADVWSLTEPEMPPESHLVWPTVVSEHPLVAYVQETLDGRPRRISDHLDREAFHTTALYRDFYRPAGVEYQVAFTLPAQAPVIIGVALSRGERDYTDQECALLARARPFLIQAWRNARMISSREAVTPRGGEMTVEGLRTLGLTPREAEALRWIALGRTGPDAARLMGIAPRTVAKHLERCYAKLGVTSRSEAAATAWASLGVASAP